MIEVKYNFKVSITEDVLRKIEVITSDFKEEFSGFLIGKINHSSIEINDIIFPKQTIGATSVDIDAKDVLELRKDKRWKDLLGMWHSHVSMGTFWSSGEGDESHIKFLSQEKECSLFIVSSFSLTISFILFSMKLLKEIMLDSTRECSSRYFFTIRCFSVFIFIFCTFNYFILQSCNRRWFSLFQVLFFLS